MKNKNRHVLSSSTCLVALPGTPVRVTSDVIMPPKEEWPKATEKSSLVGGQVVILIAISSAMIT